MGLIYTNIQHAFRKRHKLTCNEYVMADMIYQLSVAPNNAKGGWCWMSRIEMAKEIGVSKQSILNLVDSLIEKGFVSKQKETCYLKTSKKWWDVYFSVGKESLSTGKEYLPHDGKESLPEGGKESLPYNNIIDNNTLDNKDVELKNSTGIYKLMVEFWLKDFHPGWTFTGQSGKSMKSLITKTKKILKDAGRDFSDGEVLSFFKLMCQNLPEWYTQKDISTIDSKFNEIITEIKQRKNGKSNSKGESIFRAQR